MRLQTEEQLSLLLEGDLGRARVVVVRLHGELESLPGFSRLREWAVQQGVHLVVISGTGEPRADFAGCGHGRPRRCRCAPGSILTIGGERNVAECVKFLSDRLLLTGYGSEPPVDTARARRLPPRRRARDDRGLAAARRSAIARRPRCCSIAPTSVSGNLAFVDDLIDALEDAGHERAGGLHVEPARARERTAGGAARSSATARDVLISTLVVRARRSGGRRRAVCARTPRRPDHSGDHERHAARGVGSARCAG